MPAADGIQSYRVNLTEGGILSLRVCLNRSEWVHLYALSDTRACFGREFNFLLLLHGIIYWGFFPVRVSFSIFLDAKNARVAHCFLKGCNWWCFLEGCSQKSVLSKSGAYCCWNQISSHSWSGSKSILQRSWRWFLSMYVFKQSRVY